MVIGKFKKLLLWTFIAAILGTGSVLLTLLASPGKAKADSAADLLGCMVTATNAADQNDYDITFSAPWTFSGNQIKIRVTFRNPSPSVTKTYVFEFEKYEEILYNPGVAGVQPYKQAVYTYQSKDYPNSKLVLTSDDLTQIKTFRINITGYRPTGDDYYIKFAETLNLKAIDKDIVKVNCMHSYVYGNGTYNTEISFRGGEPPVIRIGAHDSRPVTVFQLKAVLHKHGIAPNDNLFIFSYLKNDDGSVDPQYQKFIIKLFGVGGNAFLAECGDINNYQSCRDYESKVVNLSNLQLFWNHVYNSKADPSDSTTCGEVTTYVSYDSSNPENDKKLGNWTTTPALICLNRSETGWLAKWGIAVNNVSLTDPSGEDNQWAIDCGIATNILSPFSASWYVAQTLCGIIQGIGFLADWITGALFTSVFNAYNTFSDKTIYQSFLLNGLIINKVHAADEVSTLSDVFTNNSANKWPWVIESWKWVLVLTDLFLVVVLLFLGIVNILHIQYDTYAIKKMLPLLIVGVILANFSLLIMRMLIDASNILTKSFMGGTDPGTMIHELVNALKFKSATSHGFFSNFGHGWQTVGVLLLATLFAIFSSVAFLILGVMFYIRYAAIVLLGIIAPLAFICMAFPPTQGLFKQWWGWTTKFVFMKPIAMFLLFFALKVKGSGATMSLTGWIIITALVYMAILVPWKLGGAVMAMWGGAMGSLFGTKKGGWARKPVEDWAGEKKKAWGLRANNWLNKNTALGRWRAGHQLEMATLEGENKANLQKREVEVRKRKGSRQHLREEEIQFAAGEVEAEKLEQQMDIESGKFNHISARQMRKITGESDKMEVALKYINQANELKMAQEGLTKRRDLDLQMVSVRDLRKDKHFRDGLEEMQTHGVDVAADYNEDGSTAAPSSVHLTYDRAIEVAEELRFKAKSEIDATKRKKLENVANHFNQKAQEFQNSNQSFTHGAMAGQEIDYGYYLSRNSGGRRQKIINPALIEESKVQVMSSTHQALVSETTDPTGTFGTSEWRARKIDYDNYIKGNINQIDASAAYACLVQAHATKQVMDTARRGDAKGLETIELFSKRVASVGGKRKNFKAKMTNETLKTMDANNRAKMQDYVAKQGFGTSATWAELSARQKIEAMNKVDFRALDVTSTGGTVEGRQASANRSFISRFLAQVETDKQLGLSASPGSMLRK